MLKPEIEDGQMSLADPAFRADVLAGLERRPRAIPARWFYDRKGSELFEAITDLPEYYPTRTETTILKTMCPDLVAHVGRGRAVVEFGSGSSTKTPVLLLTARGDPEDRIEGLSRGADDYMSKPFEPRELVLRIEAILRRTGGKPIGPREIKLGTAIFDMERLELVRDGAPQRLTEAEAQLLKTLALHAHAPVERMSLSPDTADITGRAVDVQVTRLRRKLEADPKNPRYLQTVRGVGYMLAPD